MCQCVEGCVKSTEPSRLKVFFFFKFKLWGEGFVGGSNIQRKHGAMDQKFELKHNFWSKYLQRLREIWHLHIISWVRRTRDITGFLSDPSYAMILTKMAKFFTKSFSFLISDSYLFCHRVNEANINVLLLSNTCESKQI